MARHSRIESEDRALRVIRVRTSWSHGYPMSITVEDREKGSVAVLRADGSAAQSLGSQEKEAERIRGWLKKEIGRAR